MDQNNNRIIYVTNKFPRINAAQSKEGAFVWPHIRELIEDVKFEDQVSIMEKYPWISLKISLPFFFK